MSTMLFLVSCKTTQVLGSYRKRQKQCGRSPDPPTPGPPARVRGSGREPSLGRWPDEEGLRNQLVRPPVERCNSPRRHQEVRLMVSLTINGKRHELDVPDNMPL